MEETRYKGKVTWRGVDVRGTVARGKIAGRVLGTRGKVAWRRLSRGTR